MKDTERLRLLYQDSEAFKAGIEVGRKEALELVKKMREAQKVADRAMAESDDYSEAIIYINKAEELESEVDEYLKKMEV